MEKLWYVVNTYSGHEAKVKEKLEMRAESMGFSDYIFRVIVPEETVVETMKDGSKKEKKHSGSNIFVKITAGILAALMVVSVGGTLVYYLIGM
mgnify:CR=1 FL=1